MSRQKDNEQKVALRDGMILQVSDTENSLFFVGRVDKTDSQSVWVVDSGGRDVPSVVYNTEVRLSGFAPGMKILICQGVVRGSSDKYWRIEELAGITRQEERAFFRQKTSVPAKVRCANEIFAVNRPIQNSAMHDCTILDVSGGGIRILTDAVYQTGDWLLIHEAKFIPNEDEYTFTCRVRRTEVTRNGNVYGCQFEGLSERDQDRLINVVFTLQRMERSKRN